MCPSTVRSVLPCLAAVSCHHGYVRFGSASPRLALAARLGGSFNPLLSGSRLGPELPFSGRISPRASRHRNRSGSGIWTGFPSATGFPLALGADLPGEDCLYPGNLRFSADGDLTRLFVTHACILSSIPSSAPRRYAFAGPWNAPLPGKTEIALPPRLRCHA